MSIKHKILETKFLMISRVHEVIIAEIYCNDMISSGSNGSKHTAIKKL